MVEQTEPTAVVTKVSFGVKKREESKVQNQVKTIISNVEIDSDEEREIEDQERAAKRRKLTHFEDGDVQGDVDEPKKAAVIPMVVEHDWRTQKLLEKEKAGTLTEEERVKLALAMPSGFDEDGGAEGDGNQKIVVEEGAKETEDADYSAISIENFGLAILRGCNWKDGDGIGKNPQKVALRLPNRRPPGLGLGATPRNPTDGKKKKTGDAKNETVEEIKVGGYIKVVDGRNRGVYGKVESRDDDSTYLFIRTAIGGNCVKVSQLVCEAVSAKEYERDSKCLNKAAYDREKDRLEKERRKHENSEPSSSSSHSGTSSSKSVKTERRTETRSEGRSDAYRKEEKLWVRTDLLVRFIDEDFARGRLYKQKVRIVDVAGRKDITIEDESGKTHYNVHQSWLETVIPREKGDQLMIVSGRHSGKLAVLADKDKRRQTVTVRLLASNEIVTADFEDVCSVKLQNEEDYE